MLSSALYHYPRVTFKDSEKYLWNPILKKSYKNLPEERVRLSFVDYLLLEAGFPKSRISFESPVKLPRDKSSSRTDLICYDKDFKPLLLVECKAPEVTLDGKVALQISRYNQEVAAPFILITNGVTEYWFEFQSGDLIGLEHIPEAFASAKALNKDIEYWSGRGFAGANPQHQLHTWIRKSCEELYADTDNPPRFISFEDATPDLALSNYYRIFNTGENVMLALAMTTTPVGATRLTSVLNHEGDNVALLSVSLDLLTGEETRNTILQTQEGIQHIDIKDLIGFTFDRPLSSYVQAISDLML